MGYRDRIEAMSRSADTLKARVNPDELGVTLPLASVVFPSGTTGVSLVLLSSSVGSIHGSISHVCTCSGQSQTNLELWKRRPSGQGVSPELRLTARTPFVQE